MLELLLRAENIDPESMNQVSVGGSANRAKALVAGTVDATLFGVDEMDKVEADPDAKVLLLVKDVLPKFVGGAVMMHRHGRSGRRQGRFPDPGLFPYCRRKQF